MNSWQAVSADPNDPNLRSARSSYLRTVRKPIIRDRTDYLTKLVAGKSVLDIGVVEHAAVAEENSSWLHRHLVNAARECVGMDVLEADVAKLQARGYSVICHDVTLAPLPRKFEIVVAGEVLEHVGAPGPFITNCAAMLAPEGRLVLTTPNPWYANAVVKSVFGKGAFVDSVDHVAWFEPAVLFELGSRAGLLLSEFRGIGGARPRRVLTSLAYRIGSSLPNLIRPEFFAKSILYEFVKQG